MIPAPLQTLIHHLAKLPGLGPRSAQRMALHLITNKEAMATLQNDLSVIGEAVQTCDVCENISLASPCHICTSEKRNRNKICVVEGVDDLWALERSQAFDGLYHVLGGVVNALEGVGPDDLNLSSLINRIREGHVEEVILALSAGVDGQTTSHLLAQRLKEANNTLIVTTLAKGVPMGADVDYLDDGTLTLALKGRQAF